MESDEGLSQAMFSGSQDERPEIGYGGGDFVQKLLAKAQFREESTGLRSPTPVKPAGRVGLRRTRRTSKEKELALLALRMPPQISTAQQQEAPSPGPVTRSRSAQVSSLVSASPSGAGGARNSPCPSLDDSTETLFGAIPPTPPLVNNGRTINPPRSGGKAAGATNRQSKPQNLAATFERSSQGPVDFGGGKQPNTPTNQRIASFAGGIRTSKSSTPVSTPTISSRTKPRGPARLLQKSPSCSQPTPSSPTSETGNHSRQRGSEKNLIDSEDLSGRVALSQGVVGRFGPRAFGKFRRDTIFEVAEEAADTNAQGDSENDASVDSSDVDELLSQAASLVEKKFIALQGNELPSNSRQTQQSVSRGRSPRSSSNAVTSRSAPEKTTSKPSGSRTPRKKRSKEGEPSLTEPEIKTDSLYSRKIRNENQATVGTHVNTSGTASTNGKHSQSSTSSGEARRTYTDDEIRRKREAALRKRQQKLNAK